MNLYGLQGKCSLIIGNHKLDGAVVELPKPLVVCRKISAHCSTSSDELPAVPTVGTLDVVSVVRKKYLFKLRPAMHFQQ